MDSSTSRPVAPADGMDVARVAAELPNRAAVVCPGIGQLTFDELNRRANQLVNVLRARGLQPGDHVALLCSNRPEFAEVVVAVNRSGLILSAVNWHFSPDEIAYVVRDCQARALIAESRFAEAAKLAVGENSHVAVRLAVGPGIDGFESYDAALSALPGENISEPCLGSFMFYTSGTTGRPKGVRHLAEVENIGAFIAQFAAIYDFRRDADDAVLSTGPLYHGGSLRMCVYVGLAWGITVVMMPQWAPEAMLELVERYRITHAFCVPTMFHRLLALPEETRRKYDVSSLRLVLHGGAPTPVSDKLGMIDWWGPIFTEVYGATEGYSMAITSEEWLRKRGAAGKPHTGSVRIVDENRQAVPAGTLGTIYVKPMGRFEYFNAGEQTAAAYDGDFITVGDLGYLDEDGYLYVTGRSVDLVISGGTNIYPAEIDSVLLAHPAVADAATFGVPDPEWGEVVQAVVVPVPGREPTPDLARELMAHCKVRLGSLRTPHAVDFVSELPRSEAGKVLRKQLRDRYCQ
jgi:long-chain acyl-CoA synthetase